MEFNTKEEIFTIHSKRSAQSEEKGLRKWMVYVGPCWISDQFAGKTFKEIYKISLP